MEIHRKTWATKLNMSSSPEELLQVLDILQLNYVNQQNCCGLFDINIWYPVIVALLYFLLHCMQDILVFCIYSCIGSIILFAAVKCSAMTF